MNEIQSTLLSLLPSRQKNTLSGWSSFNAPCCHHRGESRDTRNRGGILLSSDGFVYHCFNCSFSAGWQPGKVLSSNTKNLFKWLGLSDFEIGRLSLITLKLKDDLFPTQSSLNFSLTEKQLPVDCKPITQWIEENCVDSKFTAVVDYLLNNRGMGLDWYPWHWTPAQGYSDRIIIPYFQDGIIVGWAGRKITSGRPKYITEAQPGYVFNIDRQTPDRNVVILVEGILDAIAIDGIAALRNELNETQRARIASLNRDVIIVPDKDKPGAHMLKYAIEHNWEVSLPPWEDDIKDVADAVKRYGRLYVLSTILHYRIKGEIKINLVKKRLEKLGEE